MTRKIARVTIVIRACPDSQSGIISLTFTA